MSERPILMSAPMVRAILAGRKTMTRRVIKPLTAYVSRIDVGDRLWVRETCRAEELPDGHDGVRYIADDAWSPIENTQQASDAWVALNHYRHSVNGKRGQTVPPIHMPRWASRITLTVKEVKVERLQDIGEEDAEAEGARYFPDIPLDPLHRRFPSQADRWSMEDPKTTGDCLGDARFAFANFWLKLHGQGAASWDANPWVTAVRFTAVVSRAVRGGGVTP